MAKYMYYVIWYKNKPYLNFDLDLIQFCTFICLHFSILFIAEHVNILTSIQVPAASVKIMTSLIINTWKIQQN